MASSSVLGACIPQHRADSRSFTSAYSICVLDTMGATACLCCDTLHCTAMHAQPKLQQSLQGTYAQGSWHTMLCWARDSRDLLSMLSADQWAVDNAHLCLPQDMTQDTSICPNHIQLLLSAITYDTQYLSIRHHDLISCWRCRPSVPQTAAAGSVYKRSLLPA